MKTENTLIKPIKCTRYSKLLIMLIAIVVLACSIVSKPTATQTIHTYTPTSTETLTQTLMPTETLTLFPTYTDTPIISKIYMEDDGKGHRWCNPDMVNSGRIEMDRAIGRWRTKEEAYAAIDDSWPPFVANDKDLTVTHLERSEVQWHTSGPNDPDPGWGFSARVEIWLDPGVYYISSLWLHDLKTCTLTVSKV